MPVLAIKTELKCKLCSHPARDQIDAILEKRSRREEGYSLDQVLPMLRELGVVNPTKENLSGHWKRHCEVVTQADFDRLTVDKGLEAAQTDERVRALVGNIVGPDYFDNPRLLTPDESLELVRALGTYELVERVRKGEKIGVTLDHLLKSIDSGTKRKANEAAGELMSGLGRALGQWAADKALPPGEPPRKELGAVDHEVIDAEAVEVE